MAFVFAMTFGPIGGTLSDLVSEGVDIALSTLAAGLESWGLNPVAESLLIDGVGAGVGAVIGFLPTIVTLFFFLSILEDSGYMARVAFVMDRAMRKIGLSGAACAAAPDTQTLKRIVVRESKRKRYAVHL